ncbi:MAG: ABC transporter substrate-binding protein [Deltaproteobacteria bacterium]|nr:ABC transporter substrate-binding protein [Deltaproteobacteria bacterium]
MRRGAEARWHELAGLSLLPWVWLFFFYQGTVAVPALADKPAPDPDRGREIFRRGVDADGKDIQAAMGPEGVEVPASLLPCASCHGHDGRGRPEGGISPSNLTWEALTKPYGVRHEGGREHPPYDEASLRRAITMGVDSAGNPLNSTMPQYRLSRRDADDLVAYLKLLGREQDPGLSEDSLRIGTVLPSQGPFGDPVLRTLEAFFDELNEKGGIYGRRIELSAVHLTSGSRDTEAEIQEIRQALEENAPFALVAPSMALREEALAALLEEWALPTVGPFATEPWLEFPPNRYVFYLYPGLEEQVRALVAFAEARLDKEERRLLVVHSGGSETNYLVEAVREQARLGGWVAVEMEITGQREPKSSHLATSRTQPSAVMLLDSRVTIAQLLASREEESWDPFILIPGSFAGPSLFAAPAAFRGEIFAAFPVLPGDTTPAAYQSYRELAQRIGLESTQVSPQLSALSAARLLVEALQRAGRKVSREKMLEELEGLYQFGTGFTPPVSYNPNRRLGVLGAHIVTVDPAEGRFVSVGKRVVP